MIKIYILTVFVIKRLAIIDKIIHVAYTRNLHKTHESFVFLFIYM